MRPWSAAVPMKKTEGPLYEFACHEGNYSLAGMLRGARADEGWPTIEVHGVDFVDAGAPVLLEAAAAAHGGARLERVEFLVDGVVVGVDTEAPYEVTWTEGGTGRHTFQGTAHDSKGRVEESAAVDVFIGIRALERSIAPRTRRKSGSMGGWSETIVVSSWEGESSPIRLWACALQIFGFLPIHEAYLRFTKRPGPPATEPTELTLHAELAGDAVAFTEIRENISVRQRTAASVNWSAEPWEVALERSVRQRTPDLAALIQEVVDRPDWNEGNALVLLISGSGERLAVSYSVAREFQVLDHAPRLYIGLAKANP